MHGWSDFYVIVGAAGSTLIGIQFVVITVIAAVPSRHTSPAAVSAFGTPTVFHFAAAVAISAIMTAPWPSPVAQAIVVAICAAAALAYAVGVIGRARRQSSYEATTEDWVWFVFLPCTVYAALAIAAIFLPLATAVAPFVVAGAALALLLVAIHNAWDSITFLVLTAREGETKQ